MSTELGRRAEGVAAEYLIKKGHRVVDRNWRNRFCEIDLVTSDRFGSIHFVEVKYRKSSNYGSGFDYINHDKIVRMRRAALMWLSEHRGVRDFQIDVMAVEGDLQNPVIEFLPNALVD